jgi:hypothetical protein
MEIRLGLSDSRFETDGDPNQSPQAPKAGGISSVYRKIKSNQNNVLWLVVDPVPREVVSANNREKYREKSIFWRKNTLSLAGSADSTGLLAHSAFENNKE